ncbi:hypothetical protein CY0110_18257 [Crocosphaera chwakensis CCY0110]|uniref:Uncharacterized protein n=1 Tax=Crocosphaera chwakensis CCY0110 TaxID=391612 RepID=A3IIY3_9CHRO|nr:hypothetical protein CY0110_18257 [Crocosphaera chwakensis CCY0110]
MLRSWYLQEPPLFLGFLLGV